MSELVERVRLALYEHDPLGDAKGHDNMHRIQAKAALAVVAEWLTAERFLASATAIREQIDAKEPPHA